MPVRFLAVACALVFVAGVAAAATHDTGSVSVDQASVDTDRTDPTTTTTAATDDSSTTSTAAEPAGTEDTDPATPAETAPPPTSAPTTTAPAGQTSPASVGTTPGTYVYDVTGTANGEDVSGTSTLEVAEVGAEGRQTHVQSAPDGTTTTIYRHAAEGTYLESLEIESEQGSFILEATAPFLLVPSDAGPGTTTSGTMKGDDLTAEVTFTLQSVAGDRSTAALQVELSGKVQGFDVEGTMDSVIVARASDRLPLEIDAESDISVGGGVFRIRSDTRSVLRQ